jgi:hypothetical protein
MASISLIHGFKWTGKYIRVEYCFPDYANPNRYVFSVWPEFKSVFDINILRSIIGNISWNKTRKYCFAPTAYMREQNKHIDSNELREIVEVLDFLNKEGD